jgi:hypothetical protein
MLHTDPAHRNAPLPRALAPCRVDLGATETDSPPVHSNEWRPAWSGARPFLHWDAGSLRCGPHGVRILDGILPVALEAAFFPGRTVRDTRRSRPQGLPQQAAWISAPQAQRACRSGERFIFPQAGQR